MKLKNYSLVFLFFFICSFLHLEAQCDNEIIPGNSCISAPLVGCELNGYVGTNEGYTSSGSISGFCGNIENDQHFKLIVEQVPLSIRVTPSDCNTGEGLQIILYTTSDCQNYNFVSDCASLGIEEPLVVDAEDVQVGDEIYLLIDGFVGDECNYTIEIIDDDEDEIAAGDNCLSAPLVGCELDGYEGNNAEFTSSGNIPGFCGLVENDHHFKFIATEDIVAITITPSSCDKGLGLQALLYSTDDCTNFTNESLCGSFGTELQLNVVAVNVEIGDVLYLVIDGFEGDICDYTIDVIQGLCESSPPQEMEEKCSVDVSLSFNFLRRCFENDITLRYCNLTGEDEEDVNIEVALDPFLDITYTEIPIESQIDTTTLFNVGDLENGSCDEFIITVVPNCQTTSLGQEHCLSAHVVQGESCFELDTEWNGANIEVAASCVGDTAIFTISNTGLSPTLGELNYVLRFNDRVSRTNSFTLDAGEHYGFLVHTNISGTYTLFADQEAGHPFGQQVYAVAECTGTTSNYAEDFNNLPVNENPSLVSLCAENIGSYDPNDKTAIPRGWGEEHFIPNNQSLDYKIRFQNTGSDTAFTVVIRDTISNDMLDMMSFEAKGSSHTYTMEIEENNILVFTFDNILLPDSTTNLIESNGYIEFSIDQLSGNLPGTKIENKAAIFFDFNEAIITNTVFHTVETPVVYSITNIELCDNETYDNEAYTRDTTLSTLHATDFQDSLEIIKIAVMPTDSINLDIELEFGEFVNDIPIFTDTTIVEHLFNSFGCDSTVIKNYFVEQPNAVSLLPESNLEIYPNPTKGNVFIQTNQSFSRNVYHISLINSAGIKVYENELWISANENIPLNFNKQTAGVYILSIASKDGLTTNRIVLGP